MNNVIEIRRNEKSTVPETRWMEIAIYGWQAGWGASDAVVRHTQDAQPGLGYDPRTSAQVERSFDETFGLEPFSADPDYHAAKADRRARWGHD